MASLSVEATERLAAWIINARRAVGISQDQLASAATVASGSPLTSKTIGMLERGEGRVSTGTVAKLDAAFTAHAGTAPGALLRHAEGQEELPLPARWDRGNHPSDTARLDQVEAELAHVRQELSDVRQMFAQMERRLRGG